jgi:hypothetical protein
VGDYEARLCGLEDRDGEVAGEVAGMWNVVHSNVESNDTARELEACLKFRCRGVLQVLLLDVFPIKELVKVDVRIFEVGYAHVRCGSRLIILSFGHVEIVLRYGAIWHSDVSGRTNTWSNSVASLYNHKHRGRIGSPVNLAMVFACDERLFHVHSVDAGERGGDGLDVNSFEGIDGAVDVEIEFDVSYIALDRTSWIRSVSKFLIVFGICSFNVAQCSWRHGQ